MSQAQAEVKVVTGIEIDLDYLDDTSNETRVTHNVSVVDDDEGNSVSGFIIVGMDSSEHQAVDKKIRKDNIKRAAKRKKQVDATSDEGAELIAKTVDSSERERALAVTVGWYGFNSGGKPMVFDKAVVEKMFNKYPTWQDKVLEDLEKQSNFTKALLKA